MTRFRVDVEGAGAVSVLCSAAETGPRLRFVYAPGAGSSLNDPFGAYCAEQLPRHGFEVWRFQFPYMGGSGAAGAGPGAAARSDLARRAGGGAR